MAIPTGTRLGPYEVLSAVGAGGMGEVYRARDTRLDRTVAIKILPDHLSAKPDLRERFEREARTIASLNHPHICTLHDIGHQDGADYLVMEYMEGETLAHRLLKGALPIDHVLQYAIQIADALDKAHRKGVTHRDLKPGNIMLTKSGAKLLDFGLAKLKHETVSVNTTLSALPTADESITAQGTILGTLQYMAPEQVEGQGADARTDIFAFGAVVYEIATGKKAFEGKSKASLIAKILETDPPSMSSLQPMTPPALDRVVRKCLAKEPEKRWQAASDVCDELKWIAEGGSQAGLLTRVASPRKGHERLAWAVAAIGMAAAIAFLIPAILHFREPPVASPSELRTEINTPSTIDPISFALSPDGRQIVFVASGKDTSRLWLRRLDGTSAQSLVGTENASYPFWSPDSRSVGFFADGSLKRIDVAGGSPQTLVSAANRGGTWSADGTILFTPTTASPLFRVPATGGEPVAATKLDKQNSHRFPQFLPDGRQFLFYAQGTAEKAGIFLGSLDSSATTRIAVADVAGAYMPNGWLFFIRGGTLFAQRLDLGGKKLTGDPITVVDAVSFDPVSFAGAFSVSPVGLVAYRAGGTSQHQLTWFDRSGKTMGTLSPPDESGLNATSISPDGRRVAVTRTVQGNSDIWLVDATRATRFTFDPSLDRFPVWSPDGGRVVFDSNRTGHRDLYLKSSSGAGNEELLLETQQDKVVNDWSRDGRFLLYSSLDPQTSWDIWVMPMEGERKPFVFLKTNFDERRGQFSPDGHWLAYLSNESGRYEIYVRPFSGASPHASAAGQWQLSTSGGMYPRWRHDGKELYYIAPDGKLMAAAINASGTTLQPGTPVALFQTSIFGSGVDVNVGTNYDVSNDGRFLINTVLEGTASPISLLQNWQAGLKK